jgi:hypothetical protein
MTTNAVPDGHPVSHNVPKSTFLLSLLRFGSAITTTKSPPHKLVCVDIDDPFPPHLPTVHSKRRYRIRIHNIRPHLMVSGKVATDNRNSSKMPGNATPTTTTTTTTESNLLPLLHAILKSCILIGLGIIAGYGLFHTIFHHRCADVLDEMERGYNQSLASLSELYQKSVEDHKLCLDNDDKMQEISELRGRLEAQADLVNSHRSLVQKHQVATSRVEEIQAELERKEAELFIIQKRIDLGHQEKDELERELKDLKESVEVELGEKTKMIETLQSSVEAFQMTEREMLQHVQSRHGVMSRQL